ncbi:MAG: nitrate- and nitrite sensing domain-containing protein [Pseudohongiellaceae bacterium]|nr:nitrate- and nitrite sensing domain-containing protein [Pseudohongiellaceae bacterium]
MSFVILVVSIAATLAFMLYVIRNRQNQQAATQTLGLSWLHSLRIMLAKVQQHRGLSGAYLTGKEEVLPQLRVLQSAINAEVADIPHAGQWMRDNERWVAICEHWSRLEKNFENNTAANNFTQHNRLIENLLCMIDDMAQAHELLALKSKDGRPLYVAWRDLLLASECVGQARALGTTIISVGVCDTVSKIRLKYLVQKIESSTATAWAQIPATAENVDKLQTLLRCIDKELMSTTQVNIGVTEYFAMATDAIDSLFNQYDAIISEFKRTSRLRLR